MKSHHEEVDEYINRIIGSNITAKPSEERLKKIYSMGADRFSKKIPPGYMDSEKEIGEKYGDLVGWLEMIEYCQDSKITSLIFVTDDNKEDWWEKEGRKTVGPRPELVQEMKEAGIKYLQYRSERFIELAAKKAGDKLSRVALGEIKSVSEISNNLDKMANLVRYSPSIVLRRIEGLKEVKSDKEISSGRYFVEAVAEIDAMIEDYVKKDKDFPQGHLRRLCELRREHSELQFDFYIRKHGFQRAKVVEEILYELERQAAADRSLTLSMLRKRVAVKSKKDFSDL